MNAGRLFKNAVEVCYKAQLRNDEIETRREALASILFATISTETFINELHHSAEEWTDHPLASDRIRALAELLQEAEKTHSSIEAKYQLAKFILSGEVFERGSAPFQEFALLNDVRNVIVHQKPLVAILRRNGEGRFGWAEPKIMVRLEGAGVVEVSGSLAELASHTTDEAIGVDLVGQISTFAVASWACKAASGIVNGILDAFPEEFGGTAHFYKEDFKLK